MRVVYINDLNKRPYLVEKSEGQSTLSFLQTLVDGYVECLYIDDNTDVWVNDEGLFRNDFVTNIVASVLANRPLVGPAVITGQRNGDTISVPDKVLDMADFDETFTADEVTTIRRNMAQALIAEGKLVPLYDE